MSYHVLPTDDIFLHTQDSTCACEPRYEEHNGEMVFVHNSWDKREWLERSIEAVKNTEDPDTNKSVEYFAKYCLKLSDMACNGYISHKEVEEKIKQGYAHLYAAWRRGDIEITFE